MSEEIITMDSKIDEMVDEIINELEDENTDEENDESEISETVVKVRKVRKDRGKERGSYGKRNEEYYDESGIHDKKKYYELNKERILSKGSKKVDCLCGATVRKDYLAKHCTSKKHLAVLAMIEKLKK